MQGNAVLVSLVASFSVYENHSDCVIFGVFMRVTMKNAIFWDVTPCGSCKNRRSGGTYRFHHQDDKNQRANVPTSPILVTLMMEAIRSS
jgi:hypothetical protein